VDCRTRWRETLNHSATLEDLQRASKNNGASSPCVTGCRSVCWKVRFLGHTHQHDETAHRPLQTFILSEGNQTSTWIEALRDGRNLYAKNRDRLLQFIKHPEALTELSVDPLADDADVRAPFSFPSRETDAAVVSLEYCQRR
jgi:TBC1 domain family protein 5